MRIHRRIVFTAFFFLLLSGIVRAQSLPMLLNPVQSADQVVKTFKPLADYLSETTGLQVEGVCETNHLANWQRLLRNSASLLMIQPPHITAYMMERHGYHPLAVVSGRLSISVVTSDENLVLENRELIGKRLATTVAPSLGGIVANQMFVDPIRRPVFVEASTVNAAVDLVRAGKAFAAAIPTPLVGQFDDLNVVMTTQQYPLIALSASPQVSPEQQAKIQQALLSPANAQKLQAALDKVNLAAGFVAFDRADFNGLSNMLRGTHGYQAR